MSVGLARDNEPRFSQPFNQIILMLIVLCLVGLVGYLLAPTVWPVFQASPYLNGLILAVFVFGVLACFWQLITLIFSVSWIEGFALDRPGHEFARVPRLLAPLAALLSDTRARRALTSTSTRSILDSVGQRLDEARDITRYIVNLLIFLGLLGTFYGLATTVPAVVETIRSLAPAEGSEQMVDFGRLMEGLESQLGGMGTAFASSLLGLAGSLVVGLLELFAGHGQNRFYMELEEWLSSITRIGLSSGDGDRGGSDTGALAGIMEQNAMQIETLRDMIQHAEERRLDTDQRIVALTDAVASMADRGGQGGVDRDVFDRLTSSQENLAETIAAQAGVGGEGMDAEARNRLRNIDVQLLRILEEMSAGRQDSVSELRAEIAALTQAVRELGEG